MHLFHFKQKTIFDLFLECGELVNNQITLERKYYKISENVYLFVSLQPILIKF